MFSLFANSKDSSVYDYLITLYHGVGKCPCLDVYAPVLSVVSTTFCFFKCNSVNWC